jgi:putative ABC transport system permease protein
VRLISVDAGFHSDRTLVVPIDLPSARYATAASARAFFDRLLPDLGAIPGVESVGATSHLPLGGADNWMAFSITGRPTAAPGQSPTAAVRSVTPGYFRTLGIPIVQGRGFEDRDARVALPLIRWYPQQPPPDGADSPQPMPVALVSEAAARQFWPGASPVGQRIRLLFSPEVTIVGVVGDVRHNELSKPAYPTIYVSHNQEPWNSVSVVVRTASRPSSASPAIRERVRSADPLLPVSTRTLDDVRAASVAKPRLYAGLAGLFSITALVLAVVGIVGVLGYAVAQRTREIGVRVALGAEREEILRLVVRQGMRPVIAGIAVGIAGGIALMRYVQTLLFEIAPTDPMALVLTPALMMVVALAACWIPARRAAALDPVTALRAE